MKLAVNALVFQVVWFSCVLGAGRGYAWLGPLALTAFILVHRWVAGGQWSKELGYAVTVGVAGTLLDTAYVAAGLLDYASNPFAAALPGLAPPWIAALWIGFALTLNHSLGWLRGRTLLAVTLGAFAGALSYFAGAQFDAVSLRASPWLVYGVLAVAWGLAMPLLLALAERTTRPALAR